jgi:ergothioneine biosynthesis protein EgtB
MLEISDTPGTLAPLAQRYAAVRSATERLATPLSPEDQTVQSMPDASPAKWHRAHTTWFFETFVLAPYAESFVPYDPAYGFLFNSYYEAVGDRHPRSRRGLLSRPGANEIGAYRHFVDGAMSRLLDTALPDPLVDLVNLGVHHEQQHQELLLMDIKHMLSCNPLSPVYAAGALSPGHRSAPLSWVEHPGGVVEIGHAGPGFSFDNETPSHPTYLSRFALADRPTTCGDWLLFLEDGGYQRPQLWLSDGWATVHAEGWEAPLYWSRAAEGWEIFTLHGRRPVDLDEPVCHISYYEADAYARWSGARLPTESEWEVGATALLPPADLLAEAHLHPRPVDPQGAGFGEVWEWTASAYAPYPGFRCAPGAVGEYNGKFMVNQHVLRGGSCVTPPGHVRPTYRNFFPPAARWPFAGLRLAQDR